MMDPQTNYELPSHFTRPRIRHDRQGCLFKITINEWLVSNDVNLEEIKRWQRKRLILIPLMTEEYNPDDPIFWHLGLVRDLCRAGLPDYQIIHLLAGLPDFGCSNPDWLTYSFRFGWVEQSRGPSLEEQLDEWFESANKEDLEELREKVDKCLEHLLKEEEE